MKDTLTFERIVDANTLISTTPIKGKEYAEVHQRVKAFRCLIPDGFITTDIVSNAGGMIIVKATAGYYDDDGKAFVLGTGLAYEKEGSNQINRTSFLENCETSAVGRCLGFIGLGIDSSIASANETANAIYQQESSKRQNGDKKPTQAPTAQASTVQASEEQAQYLHRLAEDTGANLAELCRKHGVVDGLTYNQYLILKEELEDLLKAKVAAYSD